VIRPSTISRRRGGVADLHEAAALEPSPVREAIQYRSLDRRGVG